MPSRKKAQGKARKADKSESEKKKKEASKPPEPQQKQKPIDMSQLMHHICSCSHGFTPSEFPEEHVCKDFIRTFLDVHANAAKYDSDKPALNVAYFVTLKRYPEVWNDSPKLEFISSYFVWRATNLILQQEYDVDKARFNAANASYFEQYAAIASEQAFTVRIAKYNELCGADEHTLVSYLKHRITCSCLEKKYKEVKSIKKMGKCCNQLCSLPNRHVERSAIMHCTRCRCAYYCSRDCQVADWPNHKECCTRTIRREKMLRATTEAEVEVAMQHAGHRAFPTSSDLSKMISAEWSLKSDDDIKKSL
jgi:hypothetical protein